MPSKQGTKSSSIIPSDLTETERDLLAHLRKGYELETDPLGGDPLLRSPVGEGHDVMRPLSATRNTVRALQERGLIADEKGTDPLRTLWRLRGTKSRKKSRT